MIRSAVPGVLGALVALLLVSVVPGPSFSVAPGSHASPYRVTVATSPSSAGAVPASVGLAPSAPSGAVSSDPASAAASSALHAAASAGLKPNVVFVPRPSATPEQLAAAKDGAPVTPLYTGSPAPMGLAYYGVSAGAGNLPVGTILNTTRLRANVDANATGIRALDLVQSSPDSYGIQLNAVVTGVTLSGHRGYSFWTQNVVLYYPDAHQLILVSNVWNFTSASGGVSNNAILYNGISGGFSDGPNGTNDVGLLGFYYGERIVSTPVTYPFNLTLFLNSTVVAQRNAVSFGIELTGPSESLNLPAWDYVVFNSVRPAGSPVSVPANYTANGLAYNALGLTNDFELTFGGPGGGSQATLFAADATLGLAYYSGAAFVPVPAAYSYGGETGETATGANVAWSNAPGGPAGLARYATMSTGPSFLAGLWNATGPEGSYPVTIAAQPANALSVVSQVGAPSPFVVYEPAVAPTGFGPTLELAPGTYSVLTELSGYASISGTVVVGGPTTVYRNLTAAPALGVYTPLWAFSNAEVAALATAGSGTPGSPYAMPTSQPSSINATFGLYNDFGFPVYPAVLFYGTSVPVEFNHPPSFSTQTNRFQTPGSSLPSTNDPPYWFWNVSNVSLVNATNISGWFSSSAFSPLGFDPFSVVFYESNHVLVAGNAFHAMAGGLLLYTNGSFFGPDLTSGGNSTVWGNTFTEVPSPAPSGLLTTVGEGIGIEIAESNDTIYNNWVGTPTTAWQLPLNLYTGVAAVFPDAWNISRQPASTVRFASGFPFEPLSGSIVGTSYQGGNFWWDYGNSFNPYNGANDPFGELPYSEAGDTPVTSILGPGYYSDSYLYPGGDFVPLTTVTLYTVTVTTNPVSAGLPWGVDVWSVAHPFVNATAEGPQELVYLPNGTYNYRGVSGPNFTYGGPKNLSLTISGANASVLLTFHIKRGERILAFGEAGLPRGTRWSVTINGTTLGTDPFNATGNSTTGRLVFAVAPGTYTFTVAHLPGYTVSLTGGSLSAASSNAAVHVRFRAFLSTVTFNETGLPNGTGWSITMAGKTHGSTHNSITFTLPNGTYAYAVHPKAGYTAPYTGNVTVAGTAVFVAVPFSRVTYSVMFSETGLPSGTNYSVRLGATTLFALAPASIVFAEPNGTYSFSVLVVAGYHANPASGSVHVAAGPASVPVTYTPTPPVFASPALTAQIRLAAPVRLS